MSSIHANSDFDEGGDAPCWAHLFADGDDEPEIDDDPGEAPSDVEESVEEIADA